MVIFLDSTESLILYNIPMYNENYQGQRGATGSRVFMDGEAKNK